jgi:hypothetical protein
MRHERGASLIEFALVVPVFIALTYAAVYLAEVGIFKLKAQEIAHYGAWAFAQKPLSNYEDDKLLHHRAFATAQSEVRSELTTLYSDFDAATSIGFGTGGAWAMLMSAKYQEPQGADLRNANFDVVPDSLDAAWGNQLSQLGIVLTMLSVGTSVQSLVNGIVSRLHMNTKGLITSRATVQLGLPEDADDRARSLQMARAGKTRGADLSRWEPDARLRDTGRGRIETTVLVDTWRVTEGFTGDWVQDRQFKYAVQEVSENGINALPLGPLASIIMSAAVVAPHMPKSFGELFYGAGDLKKDRRKKLKMPVGRLMARPYTEARITEVGAAESEPNLSDSARPGQVNIFERVKGSAEAGAVTCFETAPFIVDPEHPEKSPYREVLDERGRNFMGCKTPEKRGCWE